MKESILRSAIRSFFTSLSACIGFFIAIFVLIMWGVSNSGLDTKTTVKPIPNAEGNKGELRPGSPILLQIDIHDIIGLGKMTAESVNLQLFESQLKFKPGQVKGILLHMNTPGGGVTASNAIYESLLEYKRKYNVPIYAYVEGLCASGGMYIASAADFIYSNAISVIGSIGVIEGPFFNFSELLKKIDVSSVTLTEGKNKDSLNPFRPWREGEEKTHQDIIKSMYDRFVYIIAKSRPNLNINQLRNEYGAQVFIAEKARELGYIDVSNSTYKEALRALKEAARIGKKDNYQVVKLVPPIEYKFFPTSASSSSIYKLFSRIFFTSHPLQEKFLYLDPSYVNG